MGDALEMDGGNVEEMKKGSSSLDALKARRGNMNFDVGEMNITSLIDLVFLLIIFYMVVTEISNAEIEELTLPRAVAGVDDKSPPKGRLVVNIKEDGEIWIAKKLHDIPRLRARLRALVQGQKRVDENGLPLISVKIRADANTDYEHVQKVMAQCAMERIWQISFGVRSDQGAGN